MTKILVVEDDQDINRAITLRMRTAGYDVVNAFDALTGMKVAAQEKPDLAILDISMPAGNGLALAERMRNLAATATTPFIFLTASKRGSLRQRAEELGAAAFLEKPYEAEQLMDAVVGALDA